MFNFYNISKLFTHEDKNYFNLHKILGVISFINYSYKFYLWYNHDDMFIVNDIFNIGLITCHALLSISSFIFKIPQSRIRITPIIWPEGRLHSIIFGYRSIFIICIFFMYWYTHYEILNYLRGVVVFLTILSADYVTLYYKLYAKTLNENDSTMRKMPHPSYYTQNFMDKLNIFYSISQIFATITCIFSKNIDKIFFVLFPIQIAMFLMTLAKKNIITTEGWHLWYSLSLLLNYYIQLKTYRLSYDFIEKVIIIGLGTFFSIFRLKYNWNKYYMWSIIIMVHWLSMIFFNKFRIN